MASRAGYTPIGEVPSQVCWKMWSREKRAVCLSVVSLLLTVLFGAGYIIVQVIVHQKIEDVSEDCNEVSYCEQYND